MHTGDSDVPTRRPTVEDSMAVLSGEPSFGGGTIDTMRFTTLSALMAKCVNSSTGDFGNISMAARMPALLIREELASVADAISSDVALVCDPGT